MTYVVVKSNRLKPLSRQNWHALPLVCNSWVDSLHRIEVLVPRPLVIDNAPNYRGLENDGLEKKDRELGEEAFTELL